MAQQSDEVGLHLKVLENAISRIRVSPFGLPITTTSQLKEVKLMRTCLDQLEAYLLGCPPPPIAPVDEGKFCKSPRGLTKFRPKNSTTLPPESHINRLDRASLGIRKN